MLFRPLVYLQVSPGTICAEWVGEAATATVACAALSHPRTLMGDFVAVEQAMREALAQLGFGPWYRRSPVTLTHLLPAVAGGYTNVELRAFREAAMGAGSAQAFLLADHPPLSGADRAKVQQALGKAVL